MAYDDVSAGIALTILYSFSYLSEKVGPSIRCCEPSCELPGPENSVPGQCRATAEDGTH